MSNGQRGDFNWYTTVNDPATHCGIVGARDAVGSETAPSFDVEVAPHTLGSQVSDGGEGSIPSVDPAGPWWTPPERAFQARHPVPSPLKNLCSFLPFVAPLIRWENAVTVNSRHP